MATEILVIGSHPIRQKIQSILRNTRYQVYEGELAVIDSYLGANNVPSILIFCDNGYESLAEIIIPKLQPLHKDIPILVHSSAELPHFFMDNYIHDLVGYFSEPIDEMEFLGLIKHLLLVSRGLNKLRHLVSKTRTTCHELSVFRKINRSLLKNQEQKKMLREILEKITEFIKAEAWSLLLYNEAQQKLVFEVSKGVVGEEVKHFALDLGQGIAGWVAQHRQPIIVPDVSKDSRFFQGIDHATTFKTQSILAVPLIVRGKMVGVVELINRKDGKPFDEKDMNILQAISAHAAIALETSVLHDITRMLSETDDLTGLYNARFLLRKLDEEISRAKKNNGEVSFIFMDLDHFKKINDNYGHLRGRKVLQEVAQVILKAVRDKDIVGRYGGDEFVVILPDTPLDTAMRVAEQIRTRITNACFLEAEKIFVNFTASFGVASYPESAGSKEELIKMADYAMFTAKSNNRNTVYMATSNPVPGKTI